MAAPDASQGPRPKGLAAVQQYLSAHRAVGRAAILAVFAILCVLLLPRLQVQEYRYEVGRVWQESELVAPFAFPILKINEVYQAEVQRAQAAVPEIFEINSEAIERTETAYHTYLDSLRSAARMLRGRSTRDALVLPRPLATVTPQVVPGMLQPFLQNEDRVDALSRQVRRLLDQLRISGFVDREAGGLRTQIAALRTAPQQELLVDRRTLVDERRLNQLVEQLASELPAEERPLFKQLAASYLNRPFYRYNGELYEAERRQAAQNVSRYYGRVEKGQLIVSQGQRITPEIAGMLESLNQEKSRRSGTRQWVVVLLGQLVMVALLTLLTVNFLRTNRQEVFHRNRKLALLFFVFLLMTGLNVAVLYVSPHITSTWAVNYFFLVPMSMAPIMVTVFFDDRIGFFANLVCALLAGLVIHNNFEFIFIQICAGSIAVANMNVLRRRGQFFTTAASLLITYWLAYLAYNLYLKGDLREINYANLALFALNVVITLGTYPLIYFAERIFGVTSDLTYIELLDTDHPALKELSLKAPGTYQHSLQVATLAEAVATKIGANALQVRVGALFHDIGKVHQPDYFIENQHGFNPHERLDAQQSAEIIINHVDYGVELAKQHNLPIEIIDFIRTHHGTSRVEHFYRTYVRAHPEDLDCEDEFRYKGPLPTTKEMAILMLADSAEAASRSLKNPTHGDLRNLIDAVINHKIADNQLIKARITFRDVYTIKKEILHILSNVYHTRTEYAEEVTPAEPYEEPVAAES